jgi:FkbM family methyltransferase
VIPIPLSLKRLVPGYTARWRHRYGGMLAEMHRLFPGLRFGETDGGPWIEQQQDGLRLHGFWTEAENADAYALLHPELPAGLEKPYFRLFKDYLTRFAYPHMRPDLKPAGFAVEQLWGFHGQHKDAIADYPDSAAQQRLMQAFVPKADDVFIDCGAFLGFGDIRMSRDTPSCRIIAVEANKDCHALLSHNLQYNGISNVTARHNGVWREAGTLNLETGFAQANSLVEEVHKGERQQIVDTISIDGIVAAENLDRVSMLSLTLNGAEVEAIEGARDTLTRLRPRIRLAGWYSRGGEKIAQITKRQLEAYNYDVFIGPRGNTMALPREMQ